MREKGEAQAVQRVNVKAKSGEPHSPEQEDHKASISSAAPYELQALRTVVTKRSRVLAPLNDDELRERREVLRQQALRLSRESAKGAE